MSQAVKTAIVTGGSRGIGAAISTRLAADGFSVVVNYMSNAQAADDLVKQIRDTGGQAVSAQADVSQPESFARLFDLAIETFGGVDVLVNNAGYLANTTIEQASDQTFDKLVDINLKGTFLGMREAANRLNQGGRIINFSSSVVGSNRPTYGIYAATKAAVETMSRVLSKELGAKQITVNCIAPGATATELFYEGKSQQFVDAIVGETPLGRIGEVEDIAPAVAFLAGPDGAWVNGQTLRVNGGMV